MLEYHQMCHTGKEYRVIFQTFFHGKSARAVKRVYQNIVQFLINSTYGGKSFFGRLRFFPEFSVNFDKWEEVASTSLSSHCLLFTKYKSKIPHHHVSPLVSWPVCNWFLQSSIDVYCHSFIPNIFFGIIWRQIRSLSFCPRVHLFLR